MRRRAYFAATMLLALVFGVPDAARAACASGSDIPDDKCNLFYLRKPFGEEKTDSRILERMQDAGAPAAQARSYAVIISISQYPNFSDEKDRELKPAKHDLDNLKGFFVEQSFDEIIVIEDANAIKSNIDYVLGNYLVKQLMVRQNAGRLVIAFSGHGAPGNPLSHTPGAFVLQGASDAGDLDNLYNLKDLAVRFEPLANLSFQFLALIGSCYSGGLFESAIYSGGTDMFPGGKGAHAISATYGNDLAYAMSADVGSVFFDTFIAAARDPWTDVDFAGWSVSADGSRQHIGGGIVRLGMVIGSLSARIAKLGNIPSQTKKFPQPVYGAVKTDPVGKGALFFLGPVNAKTRIAVASNDTKPDAQDSVPVTGSAVVGRPDVKVFSAPDSYKIYGVDVSHWEEEINWKKVAAAPRMKFAYMKATERTEDRTFKYNWEQAKANGLRRGAFHVFSFCIPAEQQFAVIKNSVPRTDDALPFALDVLWYGKPMAYEKDCTNIPQIKSNLVKLMELCKTYFGKPIVIHTPAEFWSQFSEVVQPETIVWLQDWKSAPDAGAEQTMSKTVGPSAPGAAPWTMWQFTRKARIDGIKGDTDVNAFFGSAAQFEDFANGKSVALAAACGSKAVVKGDCR